MSAQAGATRGVAELSYPINRQFAGPHDFGFLILDFRFLRIDYIGALRIS